MTSPHQNQRWLIGVDGNAVAVAKIVRLVASKTYPPIGRSLFDNHEHVGLFAQIGVNDYKFLSRFTTQDAALNEVRRLCEQITDLDGPEVVDVLGNPFRERVP